MENHNFWASFNSRKILLHINILGKFLCKTIRYFSNKLIEAMSPIILKNEYKEICD